ncbi:MAG: YggS family pyridoxal phosphate-dependent enzyme [Candidatus Dormibacteria bacterium]
MGQIGERIAVIRDRIEKICRQSGRDPSDVRVIGASKGHDRNAVEEAFREGITDFGENYVQEAIAKFSSPHPTWSVHFIGHLQRRKVKSVPGLFDVVQTIDASETILALSRVMEGRSTPFPVCIEVTYSSSPERPGTSPEGVRTLLNDILLCPSLSCRGFMLVASTTDRATARKEFAALREMRESMEHEFGVLFPELSMGMSGDYDLAIAEGATMVRLGTALFGPRLPLSTGMH